MKRLLFCLVLLASPLEAPAQRAFNQAELDALLAPIALYPDALLQQVLTASTRPYDLQQAASWQPGTPAPRTWNPAVEALLQYPDLLARMGENPQWVADLGDAWLGNERSVMDTVQQLRARAEATGNLRSNDEQQVTHQGENIAVQPLYPQQVVYVPYYNPMLVYGAWWWTTYRPILWRPWYRYSRAYPRPYPKPVVAYRPAPQQPYRPSQPQSHPSPQRLAAYAPAVHVIRANNGAPSPAARMQAVQTAAYVDRQRALAQPSPAAVANRGQGAVVRNYARSAPSPGR